MDAFQGSVAALELIKICIGIGKFLKRIRDADRVAQEVGARIERLSGVLLSILDVLHQRKFAGLPSGVDEIASIETRVVESTEACVDFFNKLEKKIEGGFDPDHPKDILLRRFRIACRNTSIVNRQGDLDARISILQTDLVVLQLFDHAHTHNVSQSNHTEILKTLDSLSRKVNEGQQLQRLMWKEQHPELSLGGSSQTFVPVDADGDQNEGRDALIALKACLSAAQNVHERYSASHAPDLRSELERRQHVLSTRAPSPVASPPPEPASHAHSRQISVVDCEVSLIEPEESLYEHHLELSLVNKYIAGHKSAYAKEKEAKHYNRAEFNLHKAIKYSELRERQHRVPFSDKLELHEEVVRLFGWQEKWGEAIKEAFQLLNDRGTPLGDEVKIVRARQHQLLASIYYARHSKSASDGPEVRSTTDIQSACKHAYMALNDYHNYYQNDVEATEKQAKSQAECIQLLADIELAQDNHVEAEALRDRLFDMGPPSTSGGDRSLINFPTSDSRPSFGGFEVIADREELILGNLIDAIKQQQQDQIEAFLSEPNFDFEAVFPAGRHGRTVLMYAVEAADERTVKRLLVPNGGGCNVNTSTPSGLTALHVAAEAGLDAMIRCLVDHDAKLDPRDEDGETPIVKAVKAGHARSVKTLFDLNADTTTKDNREYSLLHHAVRGNNVAITQLLLTIRPELMNEVDRSDQTPLLYCAEQCLPSCLAHARVMLEHDPPANIRHADSSSQTALWHAARRTRTKDRNLFVNLLVHHGAEVDPLRPPLKGEDYEALRSKMVGTRVRRQGRHGSTSTDGTGDTGSSRISRFFGRSPG